MIILLLTNEQKCINVDIRKENDMKKRIGKGTTYTMQLYQVDRKRLQNVQDGIEERTGRPASMSKALIYLLDLCDDIAAMDAAIKKQANLNGSERSDNGNGHKKKESKKMSAAG